MYKTIKELKEANKDIYNHLLQTYEAFYDKDTGFYTLRNQVQETIRTNQNLQKLYQDNTSKICKAYNTTTAEAKAEQVQFICFSIFQIINDLEGRGIINKKSLTLSPHETNVLKTAIIAKIETILRELFVFLSEPQNIQDGNIANLKKCIKTNLVGDDIRFAFTPKQIQKYHFGYGCHHIGIGFVDMIQKLGKNNEIPRENIKLIITTRWNKLHNGHDGHLVPCVKMHDGNYYAFDPQRYPTDGNIQFVLPGYTEQAKGQAIFHLLQHDSGIPYMITTDLISPDEYMKYLGSHKDFIAKYSRVTKEEAKKFLESQVTIGNLTQEQIDKALQEFDKYRKNKLNEGSEAICTKSAKPHIPVQQITFGK